jgi:LysM repeat protein
VITCIDPCLFLLDLGVRWSGGLIPKKPARLSMNIAASRLSSFRLPILCLLLVFAMTGCWIPASSENPETPVSLNLPTQTLPPTDTATPEPTETEAPTEDLDALAADTEEVTEEVGLTEVAQLDATDEVPPVDDFDLQDGPLPTDPDPLVQAATDIIATITQEALDLTATDEDVFLVDTATVTPQGPIPTLTSTPDFSVTPTTSAPIPGGSCTHVVRAGDNLFRLSLQYNVPIRDIAVASGVANPDLIIVGQTLTIPNCSGGSVSPGVPGGGGSAGGILHTVEQGETLYQLSVRYNVPIRSIAAANGIQNVNLIYFNQQLTIP